MLQGRLFSYPDTHRHRLGANYEQIPINCPYRTKVSNGQRDGPMRVNNNGGSFQFIKVQLQITNPIPLTMEATPLPLTRKLATLPIESLDSSPDTDPITPTVISLSLELYSEKFSTILLDSTPSLTLQALWVASIVLFSKEPLKISTKLTQNLETVLPKLLVSPL